MYNLPDIGAPNELLLYTIDVGLLTKNRQEFLFQSNDEYHLQYFQQIPISRLIVNEYEPSYWQEIMLPDGTLYLDHSNDTGDAYSGDLRQIIGKELISLGINNTNYGIYSSPDTGEATLSNRYAAAQLTAHNSIGNSNDFDGSIHRSAENINSTWGWDSNKNVFIANFGKVQSGESACYDNECQPPFDGHLFGSDAMVGGMPFYSKTNAFTLYTPYSHHQIQTFLEDKIVFDPSSNTGLRKWNESTKSMEEWAELYEAQTNELDIHSMAALQEKYILIEIPQWDDRYANDIYIPPASIANKSKGIRFIQHASYSSTIHINNKEVIISQGAVINYESNGSSWNKVDDFSFNVVPPEQQGIAVTTILGYYDPDNILPSYIYPALHGAYGNVFKSAEEIRVKNSQCYAEVKNGLGKSLYFILRASRLNDTIMNRIHINIASSFSPTEITIYINGLEIITKSIQPTTVETRFTVNGRL